MWLRVTYHKDLASPGLQYPGPDVGGHEAEEGELRQGLPQLTPAHVQGEEVRPLPHHQPAHARHAHTTQLAGAGIMKVKINKIWASKISFKKCSTIPGIEFKAHYRR